MKSLIFYWLLITICTCSCPLYSFPSSNTCLPCSSRCPTCLNSTHCSSCSLGYYLHSSSSCQPCPADCQTCPNSTTCSLCFPPHILTTPSTCSLCLVANALACTTLTTVSLCVATYFPQETYCASCVLHCRVCSNMTACVECEQGFMLQYQNSVCSRCEGECRGCVGTLGNCSGCWEGMALRVVTGGEFRCGRTECAVENCGYCEVDGVCGNCVAGYYLEGNACVLGSSLLCTAGAVGSKPNQCVANCSTNTYSASSTTPTICLPKSSLNGSTASQTYFYMFNDYLRVLPQASLSNSCLDQSYIQSPSDITLELSNYYRLNVKFKGYSLGNSGSFGLKLTNSQGSQNTTYQLTSTCGILYGDITTQQLNSNTITLSFTNSSSFGLIQLLITTYKCPSTCLKCLNPDICLKCTPPLYSFNYQCIPNCLTLYRLNISNSLSCVLTCPAGYYNTILDNLTHCSQCPEPCLTCSNSSVCFSCGRLEFNNTQYYYSSNNNSCVVVCPNGTFTKGTVCVNCLTPCATCSSETVCVTCLFGFMEGSGGGGRCTNVCPEGRYGDKNTHVCEMCDKDCRTCLQAARTCTSCAEERVLFQNSCLQECREGYYLDGATEAVKVCRRCVTPCNTCVNVTACLSCSFGYLFGVSCVSNCPIGYYSNVSTFSCVLCNPICTSCQTQTYCTQCIQGYCLQSGTCRPSTTPSSSSPCIATYYPMLLLSKCFCSSCSYPCNTCSSQTSCTSCISGYLSNSSCITSCPSGFYGNDLQQLCSPCSTLFRNCKTCTETNCTVCVQTFFSNPIAVSAEEVCIDTCPETMYNDTVSCRFCVKPCRTCTEQTVCVTCVDGYVWKDGGCLLQCASGEYVRDIVVVVGGGMMKVCEGCVPPCLTCTSETKCLSCIRTANPTDQTYYNSTDCSPTCPDTYYKQIITLRCEKCLAPCQTCSSQSTCLTCLTGFLNPDSSKCQLCPLSTYPNPQFKTCSPCSLNCDMCSSPTLCSHCTNNTYLFNSTCISQPECVSKLNHFAANSVCTRCLSPCDQCRSETICVTCLSGYMFYNETCIVTCPSGYFGSEGVGGCRKCSEECASCILNETTCLNCATGFLYYQRTCLVTCPKQTYQAGGNCIACKYPCLECVSDSRCVSCQNGALDGNTSTCLSACPSKYYPTGVDGVDSLVCVACDEECSECAGQPKNCTQCVGSKFLFGNGCVAVCPDMYFGDAQVNACFSCLTPCLYCTDQVSCTKCADEYVYMSSINQCLLACPNGFFQILNPSQGHTDSKYICQSCKPQCLTCNSTTSCLLCKSGYQYQGNCLTNCPAKTFPKSGSCFLCTLPCDSCLSATICTSCPQNSGYLLIGNSSCIVSDNCPTGYYLEPNTTNCNSLCPANLYRESLTRTCVANCPDNYFKSEDGGCVRTCGGGFWGNSTYYCGRCERNLCERLLEFSLESQIIGDGLYLYIKFSVEPILNKEITSSDIHLSPQIPFTLHPNPSNPLLLTLTLHPSTSLPLTSLQTTFPNSFSLFNSTLPLQNPTHSLLIPGFDVFPPSSDLELFGQVLSLCCALLFIFRGYFALDFLQVVFLYGLIDVHYPGQLQSFLKGFRRASFYFEVMEFEAPRKYKFQTVTVNMSLLGNTMHVFLIGAVVAGVGGLAWVLQWVVEKSKKKNRVATEKQIQPQPKQQPSQPQEQSSLRTQQSSFDKYLRLLLELFQLQLPIRFLYIFYSYLSLFTICQLSNFTLQDPNSNLPSRYLSPPLALLLLLLPGILFHKCSHHRLVSILLTRKLILSLCSILAIEAPFYVAGFMVVVSMCTLVILPAQKPITWNVELTLYEIGEALQILVVCLIVGVVFAGEGSHTGEKVVLANVVIAVVVLTVAVYVAGNLLMLVLWVVKVRSGRDYIEEWMRKDKEESNKEVSENDEMVSDLKLRKEGEGAVEEVESQVFGEGRERETGEVTRVFDKRRADTAFEVYKGDNTSQQSENQPEPPGMLVRVVNKFDDFDKVV